MPPLPAVPATLKVALIGTLQEDTDVVNIIHFQYGGTPPTNAQLNTFAASVAAAWGTNIAPLVNPNYVLTTVDVTDLSSSTGAIGAAVVSTAGTRVGNPLTAGVAACVRHRIARRYRGGHPRTYLWAGIITDIYDEQTWKPAFITSMDAGWLAFIGACVGAGWTGAGGLTFVNVSYYSGFTNGTGPTGRARVIPTLRGTPVVDPINSSQLNPHFASQRRRNMQQ